MSEVAKGPVRLRPLPFGPKWTKEDYAARQGDRGFDRGYLLRAWSEDEIFFPGWPSCYSYGVAVHEIARNPAWPKFTGVDLSGPNRPGNAIVTVAVDPGTRRRYPVDVRFGNWKSNETAEVLQDVNNTFRPTLIMVEDNGYQTALEDWARATKGQNDYWQKLQATTTTAQTKRSESLGLPALQVEFRNKAWSLPADLWEGKRMDESPWARLDYEFRNYPLASSSDGVMALWFARQGIEQYGGMVLGDSVGEGVASHANR